MRKFIINVLLFGLLGFVLGQSGVWYWMWGYWIIMGIAFLIGLNLLSI